MVPEGADEMKDLKAIRARRKELGLTQKELGDLVGCNESTISQYESGKRWPQQEMLLKLAEALHMSVSEMTGDSMSLSLTPLQRQLVDATDGLSDDDLRALINVAKRMQTALPAMDLN